MEDPATHQQDGSEVAIDDSLAIDVRKLSYGASIGYGAFAEVFYGGEIIAIKVIEIFCNNNATRVEDMSLT